MSVFDTFDYKDFLRTWVSERPGGGRGEYRRMAEALSVSTTLVSQVVNGEKHFSLELASDLCDYMGLRDREADHFLLLIEYARAGTHAYRQRLKKRLDEAREKALKLSERLDKDRDLTETQAAVYYSNWAYTAVTHLIAIDPMLSVDALAERLKLPRYSVAKVIEFLMETGILVPRNGGGLDIGTKHTHLSSDSPFVVRHHHNWRLQAFSRMNFAHNEDLFYTSPMSMSDETAGLVRRELVNVVERVLKLVGPSPSEVVRCLNIDWFAY